MQFDRYTITLLIKHSDAPQLDDHTAAALQDAHMRHLAELHAAGRLLAAGPLVDEQFRGLSILNVDPDEARALMERDPAVQAGLYAVQAIPCMVPGGAITFAPTHFPRSVAEARGD